MSKSTRQSGFTIIEVVITIAIGAAVMALVLNAVAGARRSQRNNARSADVNQIAAGVNQYIATRNELPVDWSKISGIVDSDKFGHYEPSSINKINSYITNFPSANELFVAVGTGTGELNPTTTTNIATTTINNSTTCVAAGGAFVSATVCNTVGPTPPTTAANQIGNATDGPDLVIVLRKAGCANTSTINQGGIREMAIVYKLEGQDKISCLEV